MPTSAPPIEILHAPGHDSNYRVHPSVQHPRRLVFFLSLILCLAASLYYVYQRTPVYRASASILTVAPQHVDQQSQEANVQHVAVQRQLLLGQPLLEQLLQRLEEKGQASDLTIHDVRPMLAVLPIPETNLVELRAEGPDAAWLPQLVNNWLEVYQEVRAQEIRNATGATTEALQQQYETFGKKITEKREQLDKFRKNNDILSMARDENQVLARLKGLSNTLNTAHEEEIKAKARLDAVRAAIAQGKAVVPDGDKRELAQLEQRAQELREKLIELDQRYTREFLALEPSLKMIPEQLAEVEVKIAQKVGYGRNSVLTEAQQDYAAARQTVREVQQQLKEHKHKATEFTARFAEHEALQEDLLGFEERYRETEGRLVEIEVKNREQYPQVEVVEWAYKPSEPVRPLYMRDAGIALGGSLLFSLFLVWLVDFLSPREKPEALISVNGIRISAGVESPAIAERPPLDQLEASAVPVLQGPHPRELSESEVALLLAAADRSSKQLIALLMCGVTLEEAACLKAEDFDLENGILKISAIKERELKLPAAVVGMFQGGNPIPAWREAGDEGDDISELDARLHLVAVDAGLAEPEEINSQALRHTYLAYLIRQGIKFSELEQISGRISPTVLAGYGALSPAGPGKPLTEILVDYPLFKG